MNTIILPESRRYKRPFLLGQKELMELSDIIEEIKIKLDESLKIRLKNESAENVKKHHKEYTASDIDTEFERLENYYKTKSRNLVFLKSKDDKKIRSNSIIDILKDPNLDKFEPHGLIIEIYRDFDDLFEFDLSTFYNGDVSIRIKCSDVETRNDIEFLIQKWIRATQSNKIIQLWSAYGGVGSFAFLILVYLWIAIASLITSSKKDYQALLRDEAHKILEDSVSQDEALKSLEILLKIETNYRPKPNVNVEPEKKTKKNWQFIIGVVYILIILNIRPMSLVGIGAKNHTLVFINIGYK